jgi:adenine-specific DNA-methyltransferase
MQFSFLTNKAPAKPRKLRGGYYTPPALATFLSRWAIRSGAESILEPSCGDGVFVTAVVNQAQRFPRTSSELRFFGIDLDCDELDKAKQLAEEHSGRGVEFEWQCEDFFFAYSQLRKRPRFDIVLGNPPFIRFQHFDPQSREAAFEHLRQDGFRPTKLANVWSAFVQLSIELLKTGGRLAMVVPAELLQVKYASELRTRLAQRFDHLVLVTFKKLVFPDIQQEIVLLLAEGKRDTNGAKSDIHILELEDGAALDGSSDLTNRIAHVPAKHSRSGMKWTALFLDDESFTALDRVQQDSRLRRLGDLADVDIGVVTGRNSFFMLSKELRSVLAAQDVTVPTVTRTSALRSITFTPSDFEEASFTNGAFLLDLSAIPQAQFSQELLEYIAAGELAQIHTGYKCRIRKRWYDVPSIYAPDAFLFRQIHNYPLLVANVAGVTSTDTIHRVRVRHDVDVLLLAGCSVNSLTFAWAEVCGRSYGGGVLELEPGEAEDLPIPYSDDAGLDVEKVDALLRGSEITKALDYCDSILLHRHLGLDMHTIRLLRAAWERLRDRRRYRK